MSDTLREVYRSTADLYNRFNLDAPIEARREKFREEVREFLNEVTAFEHGNGNKAHLAEEAGDVIVTVIGLLQKLGVSEDEMAAQCWQVIIKNDTKSHATHVVHNGMITRRSKIKEAS